GGIASLTCVAAGDPGCSDFNFDVSLIPAKAFVNDGNFTGFVVNYVQMRFPTDNGALPDGATVCYAELRAPSDRFDTDSRSLIGRFCTNDFPIAENNWTDMFTPDAIAGFPIASLPSGSIATIPLNDVTGITNTAKTGLCLGIDGGEPTGIN